jgi:hypothetical protein
MITELGKELRKIRIDRDERLLDMADSLSKSAAFVSAVEVGKKSPPTGFEETVIEKYSLAADVADRLRRAADRARKAFTIEPNTMLGRDTAGLLARHVNELSPDQLRDIHDILSKKRG